MSWKLYRNGNESRRNGDQISLMSRIKRRVRGLSALLKLFFCVMSAVFAGDVPTGISVGMLRYTEGRHAECSIQLYKTCSR